MAKKKAKRRAPPDPGITESPPEERGRDTDGDVPVPKEQLAWLEDAKSRLLHGLRRIRRYGLYGLSYVKQYARHGLLAAVRYGRRLGRLGRRHGLRWLGSILLWLVTLSLSFFVLARGSMYAYLSMGWGTWPSIGLGLLGTVVVFSLYLSWLWIRVAGEPRVGHFLPRALIAVVAGYSLFGLLYRSAGVSGDPRLSDYYASLHPLIKLGASAYFLVDRNGVVTDLERTAEDYLGMGLPMNETSLHFKLADRYIHAMDLRTSGRSDQRNRLTASYFRVVGFPTLYHVTAADHLHVSLPVREP